MPIKPGMETSRGGGSPLPPEPPLMQETMQSTLSQDFTSGIKKVTESNLRDFNSRGRIQRPLRENVVFARRDRGYVSDSSDAPSAPEAASDFETGQQVEATSRRVEKTGGQNVISRRLKRKYASSEPEITSTSDWMDLYETKRHRFTLNPIYLAPLSGPRELHQSDTRVRLGLEKLPNGPSGEVSKFYHTLHRVVSVSSRCDNQMYEDAPRPKHKPQGHLLGERPIFMIHEYLSDFPEVCFIVYKDYRCHENCRGMVVPQVSTSFEARQSLKPISPSSENIAITSPALRRAIEDIAICRTDYQDDMEFKEFLTSSTPYPFFFHHLPRLEQLLECQDQVLSAQVGSLLDYLSATKGPLFQEARRLFSNGLVSAESLPLLFCPNQLLVAKEDSVPVALATADWPSLDEIECWNWGPDGSGIRRRSKKWNTPHISDKTIAIPDLDIYPLEFAPEHVGTRIRDRAQVFWDLIKTPKLVEYSGLDVPGERTHTDTRFMVDYNTYRKLHPYSPLFSGTSRTVYQFDKRPATVGLNEEIADDDIILLPANIHGFDLKEKKWFNLFVDNVKRVEWNVEAFRLLVLPKPTKDLIQALVEIRASKDGMAQIMKRQDIISGKGQGLIMLLHGGPGTGKTLTAESVAEIAKMPLYKVTCGDIGTNPEAVEKYLQNILYLGKVWNCVLLLDEADIFLEQRSLSDLERNSLVSVFLRILEYYEGILVLTTNRIGTFDEAFRSRIQISIHYEKLSPEFRRRIWQNFFSMLRTDGENADVEDLEDHLPELANDDMNGREIRNALSTARQLALHKKEILTWRHLDLAIKTAGSFNRYLKDVHGGEADDLARENRDR